MVQAGSGHAGPFSCSGPVQNNSLLHAVRFSGARRAEFSQFFFFRDNLGTIVVAAIPDKSEKHTIEES